VLFLNILFIKPAEYLKNKFNIPENISSFIIITIISIIIVTLINILIPSTLLSLKEISEKIANNLYIFSLNLSNFINKTLYYLNIENQIQSDQIYKMLIEQINKNIPSITEKTINIVIYSTKTIFNIILIIVLTFYTIKDYHKIKNFQSKLISKLFNIEQQKVEKIIEDSEEILRKFFIGQIIAATYIFLFTSITLSIFKVEQFFVIAFLSSIFELIPFIGAFIAFTISTLFIINKGIINTITFIIIATIAYQVLAKVIYPYFVGKILKISVMTIIISIMIGYKLYGIFGMAIAIPFISILKKIFLQDNNSTNN